MLVSQPENRNQSFGSLIRMYRHRCIDPDTGRKLTQQRLCELLEQYVGLRYTAQSISNWEREENLINKDDRAILIGLLIVFHQLSVIEDATTANHMLQQGRYAALTDEEMSVIDPDWVEVNGVTMAMTDSAAESVLDSSAIQPVDSDRTRALMLFMLTISAVTSILQLWQSRKL